jgi:prevent-host-death family protein
MTITVKVGEAKTHLSDLLARVEAGEEIIIARGNDPIAKLTRIEKASGLEAVVAEARRTRPGEARDARRGPRLEARGGARRMRVVVDASIAAAWLLPEKDSDAAEAVIASLSGRTPVPSLFWHEARNILLMAERRGRIVAGEATANMGRLRRLPLEDARTARFFR